MVKLVGCNRTSYCTIECLGLATEIESVRIYRSVLVSTSREWVNRIGAGILKKDEPKIGHVF